MFTSFSNLIEAWPNCRELANDLGYDKPDLVHKWKQRDSIPSEFWSDLLISARNRQIEVDESSLIRLASRSRSA